MTSENAHELALRLSHLIMQTAQRPPRGTRLVVLNELSRQACPAEGAGVKDLGQPPAAIAVPDRCRSFTSCSEVSKTRIVNQYRLPTYEIRVRKNLSLSSLQDALIPPALKGRDLVRRRCSDWSAVSAAEEMPKRNQTLLRPARRVNGLRSGSLRCLCVLRCATCPSVRRHAARCFRKDAEFVTLQ